MDATHSSSALPTDPWFKDLENALKGTKQEKKTFIKTMMSVINLLDVERQADIEKPKTKRVPTFTRGLDIETASNMMQVVFSTLDRTTALEMINEISTDLQARITALENVVKKEKPGKKG